MQQKGSHFQVSPVNNIVPKNGLTAMIAATDQNGSVTRNCNNGHSEENRYVKLSENICPFLMFKKVKDIQYSSDYNLINKTVHIVQSSPKSNDLYIPVINDLSVEVYRSRFIIKQTN